DRDEPIARAMVAVRSSGLILDDQNIVKRANLAVCRADKIEVLRKLDQDLQSLPLDKQDERWLKDFDEQLLGARSTPPPACRDEIVVQKLRPRFEEARARQATWLELEKALDARNIYAIKDFVNKLHPDVSAYLSFQRRKKELDILLQLAKVLEAAL